MTHGDSGPTINCFESPSMICKYANRDGICALKSDKIRHPVCVNPHPDPRRSSLYVRAAWRGGKLLAQGLSRSPGVWEIRRRSARFGHNDGSQTGDKRFPSMNRISLTSQVAPCVIALNMLGVASLAFGAHDVCATDPG